MATLCSLASLAAPHVSDPMTVEDSPTGTRLGVTSSIAIWHSPPRLERRSPCARPSPLGSLGVLGVDPLGVGVVDSPVPAPVVGSLGVVAGSPVGGLVSSPERTRPPCPLAVAAEGPSRPEVAASATAPIRQA